MGVKRLYMTARFKSAITAYKALEDADDLCADMKNMSESLPHFSQDESPKAIHKRLKEDFPTAFGLLSLNTVPRNDQYLGNLRSILQGPYEDAECEDTGLIEVQKKDILFHGETGGGADWTRLAKALKKMGAVKVAWCSEDDIDPFDTLDRILR